MINIEVHHYVHFVAPGVPTGLEQLTQAVGALREQIIMDMQQLKDQLQAVSDQTAKVFGEVSGKLGELNGTIEALQAALGNAGQTTAEVDALVNQLKDQVTALDNLIPDPTPPGATA